MNNVMNMADEQADGMRQLDAHSSLHSSSVSDLFGWAKDDWFGVRVRFELGWGGATGPRETATTTQRRQKRERERERARMGGNVSFQLAKGEFSEVRARAR